MKKILLFASALAGLFLAGSCQKETLDPAAQGGVTYEITLPDGPQTKGENGYATYDLHYEVYKTADANALASTPLLFEKTVEMTGNTTTVTLDLLNDQDYTILFWANKQGMDYFDLTDLRQVGVKQASANNDDRDAFCGMDQLELHDGAQSKTVELKRPFAQINIATLVNNVDYDINPVSSLVKVKNIPVGYNVFTGEPVGENVEVTYTANTVPAGNLTVNGTDYKKVAMNYALIPATQDNSATVEVYYEINTVNGTVKNSIPNVPVKKNYRTNIIGNLLTSNATYTIELKPGFEEGDLAPHPIYLAAANGGEVTLTEDLDLGGKTLEIKGDMSLNLNGNTVTGVMTVEEGADVTIENGTITNTDKTVSGITTNGNLTLNDVEIESARHAVRVESGKVVINGGTYKVVPVSSSTLHALNVGDNGTEAEVIIKGGTFIGPKGTTADSGSAVNVRSGSKVTIEGGDFSGGKSKTLACGGTLTVKGGSFDQTPAAFVAEGYKAVSINGKFYVLPEVVADAATNANVTAVTESTADVATALATDNGEATMFMWNDVAYIAKNGEVVIASAADEATTVRGIVEGAAGLKEATVAEGIEVVGNRTFRRCANLETVVFPSTLTEIGSAVFQSCSKLANVTIPTSVTTIGEGAFAECTSLTSINIPGGITRIEQNTFNFSGIQSIEFHEGVTYFGAQAFRDCKQLKEVVIKAPKFTVEANAFGVMAGTLPGTTIYVANTEMKAYLESTLAYKNQFTIVVPGLVNDAEAFKAALADTSNDIITLAAGVTYEGTFEVNRNVKIVSENVASGQKATIKGRVEVRSANPTFENVSFDRNETDSNNAMQTASNALQYKAVVMIYGDQTNKVTFKKCNFYNNNGSHKSAITNVAVDLEVDECYFEGYSSSIYSQANLSVTKSTFNYTGGNNVILSINGCGDNGGKVIFKENVITNKIFALSQFLSTVGFGNGTYHFDVQGNTGAGFDYYFLNEGRVANKTFADGSVTF